MFLVFSFGFQVEGFKSHERHEPPRARVCVRGREVPGFGYRVLGFRLQVSGAGFPHLLARLLVRGREVPRSMFQVPNLGFKFHGRHVPPRAFVCIFGRDARRSRVSVLMFRVSFLGVGIRVFGFRDLSAGLCVRGREVLVFHAPRDHCLPAGGRSGKFNSNHLVHGSPVQTTLCVQENSVHTTLLVKS